MDKDEIITKIQEKENLIRNKKIVAVYLFGSVANGNVTALSDVDICVIGENLEFDEMAKIYREFPENYDVSFFNEMPIWIKMRVLKGISVIVNDKEKLYDVSFRTLAEYEDFKPTIARIIQRRFGGCMTTKESRL